MWKKTDPGFPRNSTVAICSLITTLGQKLSALTTPPLAWQIRQYSIVWKSYKAEVLLEIGENEPRIFLNEVLYREMYLTVIEDVLVWVKFSTTIISFLKQNQKSPDQNTWKSVWVEISHWIILTHKDRILSYCLSLCTHCRQMVKRFVSLGAIWRRRFYNATRNSLSTLWPLLSGSYSSYLT